MKPGLCVVAAFVLAVSAVPGAQAMDSASERAERDRIKNERDQAEAAYVARERECREKFVVTSCIEQARRDRRQALERLRLQQEVLDEAQRKQRAAQRVDEIRTKVSGEEARERETAAKERRRPHAGPASAAAAASAASGPTAVIVSEPPSAVAKPASVNAGAVGEHTKKEAAYERRVEEAREHRAQVERRNAERAASGKAPAKSLPIPEPARAPASAAH
jgi:colicin import membrane protein